MSLDYAKVYGDMHANDKRFPGYSLGQYVDAIGALIGTDGATRLLDFGAGKGYQYLARRYHERWPGSPLPVCYDIGVRQLSTKPNGPFDGVICTDMLEHIEEADIPAILDELIEFATAGGFVFLGISCRPSSKRPLPDGRNVHVTIKPPFWWIEKIEAAIDRNSNKPHVVAHWDIGGHFTGDFQPFDSWA